MSEITCPHCTKSFKVDQAGYAEIIRQVRTSEFEKNLNDRLASEQEKHQIAIELAEANIAKEKSMEFVNKDKQIQRLKNELKASETNMKLAVSEATSPLDKKILSLAQEKDTQILRLENELKASETNMKLAVSEATSPLDKKIMSLQHKVSSADTEKDLLEKSLNESFHTQIQAKIDIIDMKDAEINRVKDMKAKMSIKEIGEKLEKWCENQFNILRPSAFPTAYFEKDNDNVKEEDEAHGTKGDYIFRESDSSGVEFVSIMFEMKDKMEDTQGEKNESHLKKLDQDRTKKKCEYAVLVSMLEMDSDLYNRGIVDMSHKYEKMYVVRPHQFIPLLTLIRNEAKKSLEIRNEMAVMKSQNYDIESFENKMLDFQEGFGKNVTSARKNFDTAISDIDATIKKLEKIKKSLTTSSNQLRLANDKTQDLSIKKLTRNNPTMKDKFDNLKSSEDDNF